MEAFTDFYYRILKTFQKHNLLYLIVGGYATNFHGVIRSTIDLDIWIDRKENNLVKLYNSFLHLEYSKESSHKAIEAFKMEHKIKIPFEDNLVEIIDDSICKMDFDKVYENRIERNIDDLRFKIISLDDLITLKSKSNRYRDLLDAKELYKFSDKKDGI